MAKLNRLYKIFFISVVAVIFAATFAASVGKERKASAGLWKKDPVAVVRKFIKAENDMDYRTIEQCIYKTDDLNNNISGLNVPSREHLDNIEFIKFISAEKSYNRFRPVKIRKVKNEVTFRKGVNLKVEYYVKYKNDNEPEKSGINEFDFTLIKMKNGEYRILTAGY